MAKKSRILTYDEAASVCHSLTNAFKEYLSDPDTIGAFRQLGAPYDLDSVKGMYAFTEKDDAMWDSSLEKEVYQMKYAARIRSTDSAKEVLGRFGLTDRMIGPDRFYRFRDAENACEEVLRPFLDEAGQACADIFGDEGQATMLTSCRDEEGEFWIGIGMIAFVLED